MALRLTAASSQYLSISSNPIDFNADMGYSIGGWIRFASLIGTCYVVAIEGVSHDFGDMDAFLTDYGVFKLSAFSGGGGGNSGGSSGYVDSVWYHVVMVRSSDSVLDLFVDGVRVDTNTNSVAGRGAAAFMHLGAYYESGASNFSDARLWGWKSWNRALTAAEITREMRTAMPCSFDTDYGIWPFLRTNRASDYSGLGNSWTESASPTDEDPPPVAWDATEATITAVADVVAAAGQPTSKRCGGVPHSPVTNRGVW